MKFIRFFISNPVKITVCVLLVILFGMLSLSAIPVQLIPNVEQPVITVETDWRRGSPQEVEKEIIKEQEEKLKRVSNLKKMTSVSRQGGGEIKLEFYIDASIDRTLQEVSDKLREVSNYPPDADEPKISSADVASDSPLAWLVITSDDREFNVEGAFHEIQERVKPYIERIEGVARVNIFGGRERELQVRVKPEMLAQRGISFSQLREALRRENVNVSAGDIENGRVDVRVRTVGEYDNTNDILQTIITYDTGGPVRVRDVAEVVRALAKPTRRVRSRGQQAVAMNVIRETGSNVVAVMAELKQRVEKLKDPNRGILQTIDPSLTVKQVYDETIYINDSISLVTDNLEFGGLLAVLVLLVFLRDIRIPWLFLPGIAGLVIAIIGFVGSAGTGGGAQGAWLLVAVICLVLVLFSSPSTLIVAIAIPVSIIGTFLVMTIAGRSVNVISLAGLAFAVGMVVDNAIVVLENIDRHLGLGKAPKQAAYDATKEVWGAILASTLTTLAVFIPVLTIREEAGQLFRDIALAICAAVTLSLIVSITVIPTAAARLLKAKRDVKPNAVVKSVKSLFGLTVLLDLCTRSFANVIFKMTGRSAIAIGNRIFVVAIFTVAAFGLMKWLTPPATYLPAGNKNLVIGVMMTPPAYSMEQNAEIGERIERIVSPFWAFDGEPLDESSLPVIRDREGNAVDVPPIENFFFVVMRGRVFMGGSSGDKGNVAGLKPLFESTMSQVPGAFLFAKQTSIFGRGLGGANSVQVELIGDDLDNLRSSANALFMAFHEKYGPGKVRPNPTNYDLPGPELRFRINRAHAADVGVDVNSLGLAIASLVDGAVVGDYRDGGDTIDLVVIRDRSKPLRPEQIRMVPVAFKSPDGQTGTVPLDSVAKIEWADAPQEIKRVEEQRAITLSITPPENMALETAQNEVEAIIGPMLADGRIKQGVSYTMGGSADKLSTVRKQMLGEWTGWNSESVKSTLSSRLCLSLIITFLLMAALFESFVYPLVIMFSVPLAAVGGLLGLAVVRQFDPTQQLDVLTMLGFVILIGIVVNNAILIVHQSLNFMRGEGHGVGDHLAGEKLGHREAIMEAVRTRMRPIMMTTLTSVCGMLPLVLSRFVSFGSTSAGSELYTGLGSVVIGGLVVATLFTLIVVPLVFSLTLDLQSGVLKLVQWSDQGVTSDTSTDV